jgi:hypothetical protein
MGSTKMNYEDEFFFSFHHSKGELLFAPNIDTGKHINEEAKVCVCVCVRMCEEFLCQ